MQFILDAKIEFSANDLKDASHQLVDHFKRIAGFNVEGELEFTGNISLKPVFNENVYIETKRKVETKEY